MTEKEIVEGCIREDRKAQRALWDRYSQKIFSVCLRYCRNREDAEDVLMEAFVKIYDHIPGFRFQSSLETWMRRIAINASINKIRSMKFTESIDQETFDVGISDETLEHIEAKQLMQMLEKLPDGYRTVFNLFAVEGFSHKEIAEFLQIDEGTSRSQLAKARKALQAMIIANEKINL